MAEFSIAGKQIKFNNKEDIESYTNEIKQLKDLKKLDFSGNTIGIDASELLAEAISHHSSTLEWVNFSDLYTGRLNTEIPQSLQHLLPALLKCSNLTYIDLSDNAFGLQTIDPIESYLTKAVTLEHLILTNNGMGPIAGSRIGESLFKLAKAKKSVGKPSLKTFVCGRNRLENGSINNLAVGLRNHQDLEEVRLFQNGIRPAGISKLIEFGLSKNKNLKVLDLQDNTLTTSAAETLASVINSWENLQELNLNDALLKPKGSDLLIEALSKGPVRKLLKLTLTYNEIEAKSLPKLATTIKDKLPELKVLNLNGNRFEEDNEVVEEIKEIFEERGFGELDEIDDADEPDSDEEDEEDEQEDKLENNIDLDDLEKELDGKSEDKDELDELTEGLEKTHIK